MSENLAMKPCPFCGNSDMLAVLKGGDMWWIECTRRIGGCLATGPPGLNPKEAVMLWNLRIQAKP